MLLKRWWLGPCAQSLSSRLCIMCNNGDKAAAAAVQTAGAECAAGSTVEMCCRLEMSRLQDVKRRVMRTRAPPLPPSPAHAPSSTWCACSETRSWPGFRRGGGTRRCCAAPAPTGSDTFGSCAPVSAAAPGWRRCGSVGFLPSTSEASPGTGSPPPGCSFHLPENAAVLWVHLWEQRPLQKTHPRINTWIVLKRLHQAKCTSLFLRPLRVSVSPVTTASSALIIFLVNFAGSRISSTEKGVLWTRGSLAAVGCISACCAPRKKQVSVSLCELLWGFIYTQPVHTPAHLHVIQKVTQMKPCVLQEQLQPLSFLCRRADTLRPRGDPRAGTSKC